MGVAPIYHFLNRGKPPFLAETLQIHGILQVGGCRAEAEAAPGGGFEQGDRRGAGDFATKNPWFPGVRRCVLLIYIYSVLNYQ